MGRTTVYLAGKISKHDWRGSLANNGRWDDQTSLTEVPRRWQPRAAGKNMLVTGPFFLQPESHSNPHGRSRHGVAAGQVGYWSTTRRQVFWLCRMAILHADVFFLWLDDPTAHGSLVELGWAHEMHKKIIIARPTCARTHNDRPNPGEELIQCDYGGHCRGCRGPNGEKLYGPTYDDLWFADECATEQWDIWEEETPRATAMAALTRLDEFLAPPAPEPIFGSEIERTYWQAFQGRPLAAALVPQYEYRRGCGRTFRPDFAFPQWKVAVELDGFKYHATPEAFADDLSRQREMERDRWRFVRFTGKEINADVHACIAETERFVRMIVGVG